MNPFALIIDYFRRLRLWLALRWYFDEPLYNKVMTMDIVKLREEFETFLTKDSEAATAETAAAVAEGELNAVASTETAAVALRQQEADQAIGVAAARSDAADQVAFTARELAERQKYYLAGLLGVAPPTDDPTPTVTP